MHLGNWVHEVVVPVDLENLTADRWLEDVVAEGVPQNDHVYQVKEHKEETYVLYPRLLHSFQKLHPDLQSLLQGHSHIDWNLSHTDSLLCLDGRWNILIVDVKRESRVLLLDVIQKLEEALSWEFLSQSIVVVVDLPFDCSVLVRLSLLEVKSAWDLKVFEAVGCLEYAVQRQFEVCIDFFL